MSKKWFLVLLGLFACRSSTPDGVKAAAPSFQHVTGDTFGDSAILRYKVPGFEALTLKQKKLVYFLSEAALAGRDIIYDQKYKHNLKIRSTLEAMVEKADRKNPEYPELLAYAKKVWFSRGIHHDYSKDKFVPGFSAKYFDAALKSIPEEALPLHKGQTVAEFAAWMTPILFDPTVDAKGVNLAPSTDKVKKSTNNFYEGLSEEEVRAYYTQLAKKSGDRPVSYGLNSKLVKNNGKIEEKIWKSGGMYGSAIDRIVYWMEKAVTVAENAKQKKALELLVKYYKTGDLKDFDAYNIAWVEDTDSVVDTVNGFIEVYGDPLAYKGTWEAVVSIRDQEATKRIATLAEEAQWFEDQSPIGKAFKKEKVVGISAKVITVVTEAGDAAPTTPIGINLPNSNWIRAEHGSKSVTLGNIMHAYENARLQSGVLEEFAATDKEVALAKAHGGLALTLKVDLHEVIGHASGRINPGVGTPKETLKSYSSALEEGRADLVALYYVMDPKLIELGVMPSMDVAKAAYDGYIRNALLVQMARIKEGKDLEEAHMRNRQLIGMWAFERGKADNVIERRVVKGKTQFVIRDYQKLRVLFWSAFGGSAAH